MHDLLIQLVIDILQFYKNHFFPFTTIFQNALLGMMCFGDGIGRFMNFYSTRASVTRCALTYHYQSPVTLLSDDAATLSLIRTPIRLSFGSQLAKLVGTRSCTITLGTSHSYSTWKKSCYNFHNSSNSSNVVRGSKIYQNLIQINWSTWAACMVQW